MKLEKIIEKLELLAPPRYACDWDNVGLLAGYYEKEIRRIYIALDATDEVIKEAVDSGADLLLTHHPLIFKPVKQINDRNFITRRILTLIQSQISYYAMHTNFDNAPGGMAALAAGRLGLMDCRVLVAEGLCPDGTPYGTGITGRLPRPMTVKQLGETVKEQFELPFLQIYSCGDNDRLVEYVAVCPGSGGGMMGDVLKTGAAVYITGDISHHQGIDGAACGLAVMDAGHYGLEHLFISHMKEYLETQWGSELEEIITAPVQYPSALL